MDENRNEIARFLDDMERAGYGELAGYMRGAREKYLTVRPFTVNGKSTFHVDGEDTQWLEITYRRTFSKIRAGNDLLGDDHNYVRADVDIAEAELRAFMVDKESLDMALNRARAEGRSFDDMSWDGVRVELAPYTNDDGSPVLYVDVLPRMALCALIDDGEEEEAGHVAELLELWEQERARSTGGRKPAARRRGVSISSRELERVDFTTDKVNSKVWNRWATLEPGQLALGFSEDGSANLDIEMASSADRARGITRPIIYAINFNELEESGIAPRLEPYDRRVYEGLSSLWNYVTTKTGQEVFSLKDVFHAMGRTGNPSATDKKRLSDSITKMMKAHIAIDSLAESDAYKYPHFKYEASLLPGEKLTGYVDGQLTDSLVHLFREPPLFTFARERGQFTTYSVRLLQSPLNKTNTNILIDDYLREQIAWMKRDSSKRRGGTAAKRSNKITLDAIFEAAGIKRRDARARKRGDIVKLLDHYTACGWITGYRDTGDGFEIFY